MNSNESKGRIFGRTTLTGGQVLINPYIGLQVGFALYTIMLPLLYLFPIIDRKMDHSHTFGEYPLLDVW